MQDAHGDGVAQAPHDQNAAYRAVVSDLASLVEHVQNSLRLIEQTIAREISPETSPGGSESSTNVLVLDDVSPRYMKAAAALQACDVNRGIALRSPQDWRQLSGRRHHPLYSETRAHARAAGHCGRRRDRGAADVPRAERVPGSGLFDWPAGADRALPASGGGSCRRAREHRRRPLNRPEPFPMESERGSGLLFDAFS